MSETLLRTARFRVERREYNVPGHGSVRREFVVHPGAVLILPLLSPGEVVMIRNHRFCVEPMPLAEAVRAATDGRIIDAKTIAALLIHHARRGGPS